MADIRKLVQRSDYSETSNTVEGSTQEKVQLAVICATQQFHNEIVISDEF